MVNLAATYDRRRKLRFVNQSPQALNSVSGSLRTLYTHRFTAFLLADYGPCQVMGPPLEQPRPQL